MSRLSGLPFTPRRIGPFAGLPSQRLNDRNGFCADGAELCIGCVLAAYALFHAQGFAVVIFPPCAASFAAASACLSLLVIDPLAKLGDLGARVFGASQELRRAWLAAFSTAKLSQIGQHNPSQLRTLLSTMYQ